MSKERALRRAERERQQALAAQQRERREARAKRRAAVLASVRDAVPRRTRWARARGRLADRRRAQNSLVIIAFLAVQLLTWLLSGGWAVRMAVLVLSVLLVPVLVTLMFDRRS
jgi:Flp pilus assembly protein TadB